MASLAFPAPADVIDTQKLARALRADDALLCPVLVDLRRANGGLHEPDLLLDIGRSEEAIVELKPLVVEQPDERVPNDRAVLVGPLNGTPLVRDHPAHLGDVEHRKGFAVQLGRSLAWWVPRHRVRPASLVAVARTVGTTARARFFYRLKGLSPECPHSIANSCEIQRRDAFKWVHEMHAEMRVNRRH